MMEASQFQAYDHIEGVAFKKAIQVYPRVPHWLVNHYFCNHMYNAPQKVYLTHLFPLFTVSTESSLQRGQL